jgi:hypothetical protein
LEDLKRTIKYLGEYANTISNTIQKFVQYAPVATKGQLRGKIKQKLNSTQEHYFKHTNVYVADDLLVIEIDDDWLTKALEKGASAFDMKEGMLKSSKAKTSKKGYRYLRVPLKVDPLKNASQSTDKAKVYQERIQSVLMDKHGKIKTALFGPPKTKSTIDNKTIEYSEVVSGDPLLKGLYATRVHNSFQDFFSGKSKPQWNFMLLRTVSDNPESIAKWEHPGIKAANILPSMKVWMDTELPNIFNEMLMNAKNDLDQKFAFKPTNPIG